MSESNNEDFPFARLAWTPVYQHPRDGIRAAVEIAPGKMTTVQLADPSVGSLRQTGERFDAMQPALPGLLTRITSELILMMRGDDGHEQEADEPSEEAAEAEEAGEADDDPGSAAPEPAPPPPPSTFAGRRHRIRSRLELRARWELEEQRRQAGGKQQARKRAPTLPPDLTPPEIELTRIDFDMSCRPTLVLNVVLLGRAFVVPLPGDALASSHLRIPLAVKDPLLGAFRLVDAESSPGGSYSRPAYASYFVPRGYVWEGGDTTLSPLPGLAARDDRGRFRDAIEALPTLLEHARSTRARDRAQLVKRIIDHVLEEGVDGPWWDYDLRYEIDEKEWEDEEARHTARRRYLHEVLEFSGLPEVTLFADGSALVSCSHRTSRKSDVFVIELAMSPTGEFLGCELKQVYWGE